MRFSQAFDCFFSLEAVLKLVSIYYTLNTSCLKRYIILKHPCCVVMKQLYYTGCNFTYLFYTSSWFCMFTKS